MEEMDTEIVCKCSSAVEDEMFGVGGKEIDEGAILVALTDGESCHVYHQLGHQLRHLGVLCALCTQCALCLCVTRSSSVWCGSKVDCKG